MVVEGTGMGSRLAGRGAGVRDMEVTRSRQPLSVPRGTVSVSERPEPGDDSARRPRPPTRSLLPAARRRVTRAGVPLGPLAEKQ
jgi:hypothetical protein